MGNVRAGASPIQMPISSTTMSTWARAWIWCIWVHVLVCVNGPELIQRNITSTTVHPRLQRAHLVSHIIALCRGNKLIIVIRSHTTWLSSYVRAAQAHLQPSTARPVHLPRFLIQGVHVFSFLIKWNWNSSSLSGSNMQETPRPEIQLIKLWLDFISEYIWSW